MSDWSSFNDAKKQNDAWKKFLKEDVEAKEAGINEFFFGAEANTTYHAMKVVIYKG